MNRRLYFMLPDVKSAHTMLDDLLLARVNANRIHFMAKPDTPMGDLPEATLSERTDLIEGWEVGMGLGTLVGFASSLVVHQADSCLCHHPDLHTDRIFGWRSVDSIGRYQHP